MIINPLIVPLENGGVELVNVDLTINVTRDGGRFYYMDGSDTPVLLNLDEEMAKTTIQVVKNSLMIAWDGSSGIFIGFAGGGVSILMSGNGAAVYTATADGSLIL